jgi:hypothetical protein
LWFIVFLVIHCDYCLGLQVFSEDQRLRASQNHPSF